MENSTRAPGIAVVICAPSGTGKSTLIKLLKKDFPQAVFSISFTTRQPRQGEENGVHYHFVSREEFQRRIDAGDMAEYAKVHDNFYGTSAGATSELLSKGTDVLFDIDVQGARQLRAKLANIVLVFLLPPNRQELEKRLRGRGTDDDETINKRLTNARGELEQAYQFDHLVVNDDLEHARQKLRDIIAKEKQAIASKAQCMSEYLRQWGA